MKITKYNSCEVHGGFLQRIIFGALLASLLLAFSPSTLTAAPLFGDSQTTSTTRNRGSLAVGYDQLGLSVGDVVVVSVTTDYSKAGAAIVQASGHPGGTNVYNAIDSGTGQPRLRVDVLVYDGSWPATLDYTFAVPDDETWIAYATKWTGVDTANPVAGSAGTFNGVTLNPTSPGLTAPESDLVAVAVYGAREDDFDSNGTPSGYTSIAIGASNIGTTGSSSGIAYQSGIAAGTVPAAVWTQAAATQAHAVHVLLRSPNGLPTAAAPTFNPTGGSYTDSVLVTLNSTTSAATLYYTTDGSTPDSGSTPLVNGGSFTLTSTATVKSIAIAGGFNDSVVSSQTYTVVPAGGNQPPVADAGGPYDGVAGSQISFDGSNSFDPDTDPLTYSWDFGDGSAPGSGISPNHTYAVPDTYTVSLIVNDGTENSVASTASVNVTSSGGSGNIQLSGSQTTSTTRNRGSLAVGYDQLGLSVGDVVVVSVTTDYSKAGAAIVQASGHPGGTNVYNAIDSGTGQPRLRVDVLVYDGSWPATLDYTFAVPDDETWIAYATKWTGVDTANPVAGSAGTFNGVTLNPTSPGLTAPESDLVAVAVYGAREDDFDSNGTPSGYTSIAIGASNIGTTGSSSGIAYQSGIAAGTVPAAVWTQAAATQAHAVHVLLRSPNGLPTAAAPTFNPTGGSYTDSVLVTLNSTTSAATLYYTTDGSTPDSGSTPLVNGGSFTLTSTATVKSIAIAGGFNDSVVSSQTYTVVPAGGNQPPVADAGGPYDGVAGSQISFDGSNSFDPDTDPLTYSWDFGDGSAPGSGISPNHTYAVPDTYTVSLIVNDGTENSVASTASVNVTSSGGSGNIQLSGSQTTSTTRNRGSLAVGYDQLGLSVGDVVVVSVTTDYSKAGAAIVQASGHPGGTNVYNAIDSGTGQPRLRVDVLVYDGSWPATLDYTFAVPDDETWIAYATKWTGVDTANPVAGSAGTFNGVTLNPTSPGLTAPESDLVAVAVYGAREDDFDSNGTPSGYTSIAIGASNIGTTGSSSGIAYQSGIAAGTVPAAVWTQAAATQAHAVHVLLRSDDGTPPPAPIFADNFNDGNAIGWTADDECEKGGSSWPVVNNVLMQTGDCRGYTLAEGVAMGTQALTGVSLPADVDINVWLRSEDPASDVPSGNDSSIWKFGSLGVLFGYQDANNYYRFEFNGLKGHRKLLRKQGGDFIELNTSPQSFVRGQWLDLRIVHANGVILVFVGGQQVMSVADATFSAGRMGLFCSRDTSCSFDDVSVLSASTDPQLGLRVLDSTAPAEPALPVQSFSEYFVDSDGVLDVVAVSTSMTGVGGVEFVVDEGVVVGSTSVEVSQTDLLAPYRQQLTPHALVSTGEHTVTAYLLDGGGVRMTAPAAKVTLPGIATNGIHLFTQGDSITAGLFDDLVVDDISQDTRTTAGGYQPQLNDYLSGDNSQPVTVLNDGNSGEESSEGAARIMSTLARNPEAQAYVMFYGANDTGGSMPTPPFLVSLDEVPDTVTPVTFKDYLQVMINAVQNAGKQIYLVKAPPYFANLTNDGRLQVFNQVVDQLILENGLGYVAADLHDYFTLNPGEYAADGIHPDGTGYASVARLICEQLNGQMGLFCTP